MEKEYIIEKQHSITLNVTAGQIDSYRELEKTTGTVRVYENGCIGVAGCLGEPDEEALTAQAKEALAFGIQYPCSLEGKAEIIEDHDKEIIPAAELIPVMTDFLKRLGEQCPKMALTNKISLVHGKTEYRNSLGRHLVSSGANLSIALVGQNRGSGNLMDMFFAWQGDDFDADKILAEFKSEYDAFYIPADIESGRWPVVAMPMDLYGTFLQHFIGDLYAAGASLLSGKLGEKVFSDKLTFYGQEKDSGALGNSKSYTTADGKGTIIVYGGSFINCVLSCENAITVNGGKIDSRSDNAGLYCRNGTVTFNGGEFYSSSSPGVYCQKFVYNGGKFRADNSRTGIDCPGKDVTLNWTSEDDSFYASQIGYWLLTDIYNNTYIFDTMDVTLKKDFIDRNGKRYPAGKNNSHDLWYTTLYPAVDKWQSLQNKIDASSSGDVITLKSEYLV